MQVVIMLNMILMIVETQLEKHGIIYTTATIEESPLQYQEYDKMCDNSICGVEILEFLSLAFVAVYIFEVVFKSVSLGWKVYLIIVIILELNPIFRFILNRDGTSSTS